MTRLTASAITGGYVDSSKITVTEFLDRWLHDWAGSNVTPKTVEGYALIARSYVNPHLGAMQLQKLKPIALTEFYANLLRAGGHDGRKLSPRSVGNVHRLLHAALEHAVKWGLITANPADNVSAPRIESPEVEILDAAGIAALLARLRDKSLYVTAVLGLATGMRRGEMLALRWQDIDAASGKITVARSLEQSKTGGLRFKSTKTRAGMRTIAIPPSVVAELRRYRLEQQERWLALGLGRISDERSCARHMERRHPVAQFPVAELAREGTRGHAARVATHACKPADRRRRRHRHRQPSSRSPSAVCHLERLLAFVRQHR